MAIFRIPLVVVGFVLGSVIPAAYADVLDVNSKSTSSDNTHSLESDAGNKSDAIKGENNKSNSKSGTNISDTGIGSGEAAKSGEGDDSGAAADNIKDAHEK